MKTLLGLVMVLGVVSCAQAEVELYVGNSPAPDSTEVMGSWTLLTGIGSPTGDFGATYYLGITLYSPASFMTNDSGVNITRGSALSGDAPGFVRYYGVSEAAALGYKQLICFDTAVPNSTPNGAGFWIGVTYHSDGAGTQIVRLLANDRTTVLDTLYVEDVPEPMTLTLLALGGVALLKRRR